MTVENAGSPHVMEGAALAGWHYEAWLLSPYMSSLCQISGSRSEKTVYACVYIMMSQHISGKGRDSVHGPFLMCVIASFPHPKPLKPLYLHIVIPAKAGNQSTCKTACWAAPLKTIANASHVRFSVLALQATLGRHVMKGDKQAVLQLTYGAAQR